ncbi:hypothetical protein [Leucobacter japonicus]|uniref:hypothetical protein n=1 Tax=Leucobacter japonicus TaxID=1461259 RepID=UPI0006A79612|nr:hypothetical protein [Leucobacter japonicus]
MNLTRRGLNRGVLAVIGLGVAVVGAALILATALPAWTDTWQRAGHALLTWCAEAAEATRIPGSPASGAAIAVAIAFVGVAIALIAIPCRIVARRRSIASPGVRIVRETGRLTLAPRFIADALHASLEQRPDVVGARVDLRRLGTEDFVHVILTPRRGARAGELAAVAAETAERFARLTGIEYRAIVSLRTSVRARLAGDPPRIMDAPERISAPGTSLESRTPLTAGETPPDSAGVRALR